MIRAVALASCLAAVAVAEDTMTIVLVGDVGLGRNLRPVDPRGAVEGGSILRWEEMSAGIAHLIDGDIGFMNFESVVTDRNDLVPADKNQKKPFGFRGHPEGVRHLARLGLNLVSAANNHAYDFGEEGVRETVRHLAAMRDEGLLRFAGIGLDRDAAARPVVFERRGDRVAFSAVGIVTNNNQAHRAGPGKPGTVAYRIDEDWRFVVDRLGGTDADLRILSIHYGLERDVHADGKQLREWRWAAAERGVDLIVGHHAHVVRGVQMHRGALIFYGLGNFLHRGTADMTAVPAFATARDWGMVARVHLRRTQGGRFAPRAVEVVPIVGMHRRPHVLGDPAGARRRIEVLNVLAEGLDDPAAGSTGVRFLPRTDGTGLWCADAAQQDGGHVADICRGWQAPDLADPALRPLVAAARDPDPATERAKKRAKRRAKGASSRSPAKERAKRSVP